MFTENPIRPEQVLTGPLFNEPMRVVTVLVPLHRFFPQRYGRFTEGTHGSCPSNATKLH